MMTIWDCSLCDRECNEQRTRLVEEERGEEEEKAEKKEKRRKEKFRGRKY